MRFRSLISILLLFTAASLSAQHGKTAPATLPGKSNPTGKQVYRKVKTDDLQNINEVYHLNGTPFTGTSIDMFPNNTKMQEIQWVNGLLDGTKTEYFLGGTQIRTIMHFRAGKRNGNFIFYYENGKLKLTGKYVDDLLDSTVNAYWENGNMKYIHEYAMGVRVGKTITYYNNGNLEQEVALKNEKPHGLMLTYYEAGNIRLKSNYNEGVRDGQYLRYHLTGLVAEESYYKNGFQDSVARYWDNVFGSIMKEEYFKMGKKEGVWLTFNEAGDTLTMYTYHNDQLDGPYKKYFSGVIDEGDQNNGKDEVYDPSKAKKRYVRALDEIGNYAEGKLDGEFKTGLYNKANHAEGTYAMGSMIGEWKYYNEKGKVVLHEKYNENGELIYQKPKLQPLKSDD